VQRAIILRTGPVSSFLAQLSANVPAFREMVSVKVRGS